MKLLQVATIHESLVTILLTKLQMLSPETDLHVGSSFEAADEKRTCPGMLFRVNIPRQIRLASDLAAALRMAGFIRRKGIDIVHTHTAKAGIVGVIAGKLAGVPVVHTYHGLPWFSGQNKLTNRIYKSIEMIFSRWRALVFSQNKRDFEELREGFPCPVAFEGNGVDVPEVERSAAKQREAMEPVWGEGDIRIICVSRLEPVKRVETVIKCAAFLMNEGLNVSTVIAGQGPLEERLRAAIEQHGLERRVSFLYTPYVHGLIGLADIAVLSSVKEGIPRGLMEAMALGKPVVATDVLGTNELVVHNETGFLTPFGDQESFNTAVRDLVLNPALRQRFGQAGKRRVLEHFNERRIVDMWMKEYRKILFA